MNVVLTVEGMSCNHCVQAVEGALEKLGATGKVDLSAKTVNINYDEVKISLDQIKKEIEDQGFDVV